MAYGPPWMLAWTARGRERYIVVKRIHEVGARAFISQGTAAKRSDVAVSNWPSAGSRLQGKLTLGLALKLTAAYSTYR